MIESAPLWKLSDIHDALEGIRERSARGDWVITRIIIDSRIAELGDVFIAIRGEHKDGHAYIQQAFTKGASYAIMEVMPEGLPSEQQDKCIVVEDTHEALRRLASYRRTQMRGKICGVTGSVGKTTVKKMIGLACEALGNTYITEGNLNNHYGVPLTLANMPKETDFAVIEAGMNHAGELSALTRIIEPDAVVITSIEMVHTEHFDPRDPLSEIAKAKAEIMEGLVDGGIAVLPADSPRYALLEHKANELGVSVQSFGMAREANSRIINYALEDGVYLMRVSVNHTRVELQLKCYGFHYVYDALAALAIVSALGGDVHKAAEALSEFEPEKGRGKIHKIRGWTLVDDSYNASPASMKAALESLMLMHRSGEAKGRKIAVLGDMLELGPRESEYHIALAKEVDKYGVDMVLCVGPLMAMMAAAIPNVTNTESHCYESWQDARQALLDFADDDDIVLIKGSHGSEMWKIVDALTD